MASNCGSKMRKYNTGGETKADPKDFVGHPIKHTTNALKKIRERMNRPKGMSSGGPTNPRGGQRRTIHGRPDPEGDIYSPSVRSRRHGSKTRAVRDPGYEEGGPVKKLSEMTDEERYGKTGAEIRRLDPEAYANRKDKSAEANLALLKQLREKDKAAQKSTRVESAEESMRTGKPMKDSGFTAVRAPSSGPTTRGGARRPAPAAPVARPSQGASRREFGQDLRGPKYSGKDIQTAEKMAQATLLGLTAGRAGSSGSFSRAASAPAKVAPRPTPPRARKIGSGRTTDRTTPPRAKKIGSGRTTNKNAGGSIKKYAAGGAVRGDGICRVKTKGRMR